MWSVLCSYNLRVATLNDRYTDLLNVYLYTVSNIENAKELWKSAKINLCPQEMGMKMVLFSVGFQGTFQGSWCVAPLHLISPCTWD